MPTATLNHRILALSPVCHLNYTRDTWVKLENQPSPRCFDEAKLLLQDDNGLWLAWIPDFGVVHLDRSEFYC